MLNCVVNWRLSVDLWKGWEQREVQLLRKDFTEGDEMVCMHWGEKGWQECKVIQIRAPGREVGERPEPLRVSVLLSHDANSDWIDEKSAWGVFPCITRNLLQHPDQASRETHWDITTVSYRVGHFSKFCSMLTQPITFSSFGNSFAPCGILTPSLSKFALLCHYFLLRPYSLYSLDYRRQVQGNDNSGMQENETIAFFTLEIKNIFLQSMILVYSLDRIVIRTILLIGIIMTSNLDFIKEVMGTTIRQEKEKASRLLRKS